MGTTEKKRRHGCGLLALLAAGVLASALPMNAMALLTPAASTVKPWDQLEINEQYNEFVWNDGAYSVQTIQVDQENIGVNLGNVTAVGINNKMNRFTHDAQIFQIAGISQKCAAAIQYDSGGPYYVSTNRYYTPATLGKLLEDLSLKENLTPGGVVYTYWKDNTRKKGNHITEKYTLGDPAVIWEMLLSDPSLPVAKEVPNPLVGVMEISVSVGAIGDETATLAVTTDGYLKMYVLGSGKVFFPGKEVTQSFIKHVTENEERISRTASAEDGPDQGSSLFGAKSVV